MEDIPSQHGEHHGIRDLHVEDKSISIPTTDFHSMIIPDPEKTTSKGQPETKQGRSKSHLGSDKKDANSCVRRLLSKPGQGKRWIGSEPK